MKARRAYNGSTVIFDYRQLLNKEDNKGKVLLMMKNGPLSYLTDEGVRFFKDHPFQFVSRGEAELLLRPKDIFVKATLEDVEDYYAD